MKLHELQAIAKRLDTFSYISNARRISDNTIELIFQKEHSYFFELTRGQSTVYKATTNRPQQGYNAPFDNVLHTHLASSKVLSVEVLGGDRVLLIKVAPKSSYKDSITYLQLEFTGKNTNAILLDESGVILEALRHVDADMSFRVVRPGVELKPLPLREQQESTQSIEDIDAYLIAQHEKRYANQIETSRAQKVKTIEKKRVKLQRLLDGLPSIERLTEASKTYQNYAHMVLANLHTIEPYATALETQDFEGNTVRIPLPKEVAKNRLSDYYFNLSKRAKNKLANLHIEKENLASKTQFYENLLVALGEAKSLHDLELLVPKRANSKRKKEKFKEAELLFIEDYKVLIGRNSNENQKLLAYAKASDIWMHVKDIPSSHLIIRTDKQNVPNSVLEAAAKLCVDFSLKYPGDYKVDYTKRKFVKIQEGSRVEYDKYETISVTKEGIEVRV